MKRLLRIFAVFAVAAALVQVAGAGPARADAAFDLACNYDYNTFNACLNFQDVGELDRLNAHVGLDQHLPQRYAQEIVDYGADPRGQLFAVDGSQRRFLADLTVMPGWPAAGPDGLGIELLATSLPRGNFLDEDPGQPDQDELIARVSYFDYHIGQRVEHDTGVVHGDFSPKTGGGWQCLILC